MFAVDNQVHADNWSKNVNTRLVGSYQGSDVPSGMVEDAEVLDGHTVVNVIDAGRTLFYK